jgi:hypothetical protein
MNQSFEHTNHVLFYLTKKDFPTLLTRSSLFGIYEASTATGGECGIVPGMWGTLDGDA